MTCFLSNVFFFFFFFFFFFEGGGGGGGREEGVGGLKVAFNNLSVRCLDVAGSTMLTFRVMPH